MKKNISMYLFLMVLLSSCGNNVVLDQDAATKMVSSYLKSNPIYDSEKISLGEIKFKSKSDQQDLAKYKELADKGFIGMQLKDQKKKFLSKDSSYVYMINLTDKSKPLILKQEENRATIKVMEFVMDDDKPIAIDKSNNKTAQVTVMLKKVRNAFTGFYQDKNSGSNFITKTFKLKYKKESGWFVAGE